jgi:hypothetical protein
MAIAAITNAPAETSIGAFDTFRASAELDVLLPLDSATDPTGNLAAYVQCRIVAELCREKDVGSDAPATLV